MAIWAIADIHASRTDPETGRPVKPMDVFGPQWADHLDRIQRAWQSHVAPEDTVIVAGDIDWALNFRDAVETLDRLASWNGTKILVRGNHDYWWSSKTTNKVRRSLPESLYLLHNNAFLEDGYNICGTKGTLVPGGGQWTEDDQRLLNREEQRLRLSLDARDASLPTIVALHYPPFYPSHPESPFRDLIEANEVAVCVYGHLHGDAAENGPSGQWGATWYLNVASDAVDFSPVELVPNLQRSCVVKSDDPSEESLSELAEEAMDDKRSGRADETDVRELYDVPSESVGELAADQAPDESIRSE